MTALTRRTALIGAGSAAPLLVLDRAAQGAAAVNAAANAHVAALERRCGGRLGILAIDTGDGAVIAHRPDERFAMCSTFKFLAVAALLKRVDAGTERLDRVVAYGAADLLPYAPRACQTEYRSC